MAQLDSGRGSFLAVLLGLAVLGVFAFVAGGLVGILWKEPGLLFAYLRGDTTEITWSTAAQEIEPALPPIAAATPEELAPMAAPRPSAAPPPPAPKVKLEPTPKPVAASPPKLAKREAPAPVPPPVAAPPPKPATPAAPAPRIAIQVGAFAERGGAEQLRQTLLSGGYPAYLAAGSTAGNARWRVRVGPYPAREEAEQVASRLKQALELPTWVLDEDSQ